MPLITLEMVKEDLGITTSDYDEAINAAMPVVDAWFENYCQRGLVQVIDASETLTRVESTRINLWSYPINSDVAISIDGTLVSLSELLTNQKEGWIEYLNERLFHGNVVLVDYSGGYAPESVPADLRNAYSRCVGDAAGYGEGEATGSGGSGGGDLKSINLGSGALSVAFATDTNSGGISGGYDVSNVPPELQDYASILDYYRRPNVHGSC